MIFALLFACAVPLAATQAEPLAPPMAPPPPPAAAGSMWSDSDTRALVGMDNNARSVGDLITVHVGQTTSATNGADTALSREGKSEFGVSALLGADTSILKANPNMKGAIGLGGASASGTTGKGATSRSNSIDAILTCTVVQVFPNGNLRVQGHGTTTVNSEQQNLFVEGTIRARDIRLDNTIDSSKLADSRVEITGLGSVANQQGQGWGTAIANAIWPF